MNRLPLKQSRNRSLPIFSMAASMATSQTHKPVLKHLFWQIRDLPLCLLSSIYNLRIGEANNCLNIKVDAIANWGDLYPIIRW